MLNTSHDESVALNHYADLHLAFVRIHPFADGNGRMARLLANLPVLKSGLPPILIDRIRRREYLLRLSSYDLQVGTIQIGKPLLPESELRDAFRQFCRECWQASIKLVKEIQNRQMIRRNG
ncbi:hypothetical protein CCP3SC15_3470002 [Gammaproteobacteria bacterium]